MPPKARSKAEILSEKHRILQTCLSLMECSNEDISMRQLANALGTSSTYIYQYFKNKDELYLCILTEAFKMYHEFVKKAVSKYKRPLKRLEAMLRASAEFSITKYPYFYLMYGSSQKKCTDYEGTLSYKTALHERDIAFESRAYVISILKECLPDVDDDELALLQCNIRCSQYGIVHLYKNNILREVGLSFEVVVESMIQQTIQLVSNYHQLIKTKDLLTKKKSAT
jgi:AcrR family transcriptional regulator